MRANPPLQQKMLDENGNLTVAWREYQSKNFDHYNQVDRWMDPTHPEFGKVEPPSNIRRVGLRAYANGTDWNPGSGAGYYHWTGSVWAL